MVKIVHTFMLFARLHKHKIKKEKKKKELKSKTYILLSTIHTRLEIAYVGNISIYSLSNIIHIL